MLEQVLTSLSNGLSQSLGWALLAAFARGVVSIVFSPCHAPSVPLIVGFISTQDGTSTRRALRLSLVFSLGVLASIALIGLITASPGRLVGDLGAVGNVAVAVDFFVFGQAQVDYGLAVALLGAFALGHCGVIVLAGTAAQKAQTLVSWAVARTARAGCAAPAALWSCSPGSTCF